MKTFAYRLLAALIAAALIATPPLVMPVSATDTVTVSIYPESITVSPGDSFILDLVIVTATPVRGWQAGIDFDAAKLSCNEVIEGGFLSNYGETAQGRQGDFPVIDNTGGHVTDIGYAIVGDPSGGATGEGVLVTLDFTAKEDISGSAIVAPVNVILADAGTVPRAVPDVAVKTAKVFLASLEYPEVSLSVSPRTQNVYPENAFNIAIKIDTGDIPARGAGLAVSFDATRLRCTGLTEGSFFKSWAQSHECSTEVSPSSPDIDNSTGYIEAFYIDIIGETEGGPAGEGTLCTIRMEVRTGVEGQADIELMDTQVFDFDGNELNGITVNDGRVQVLNATQSPAPSSTPTYTPTPSPTASPAPETSMPPAFTETPSPSPALSPESTPGPSASPAIPNPVNTPQVTPATATPGEGLTFDLTAYTDSRGAFLKNFQNSGTIGENSAFKAVLEIKQGTRALSENGQSIKSIGLSLAGPPEGAGDGKTVVAVFECSPDGSTFSPPIRLSIQCDPGQLPEGVSEKDLIMAIYDDSNHHWVNLDSKVDPVSHTISAEVSHFSLLAILPGTAQQTSWIILAGSLAAAVIVILGLVFWYLKRRRSKATSLEDYVADSLPGLYKNKRAPQKKTRIVVEKPDKGR